MQVPCVHGSLASSLARFQTYLTQLEAGEARTWVGGQHVFPQVIKLASTAVPAYAFLGRAEALDEGLRGLVTALNGSMAWLEAVLNGTKSYPHNHAHYTSLHKGSTNECQRISMADLDVESRCRVCRLYAMDYACLGPEFYAAPRECGACPP